MRGSVWLRICAALLASLLCMAALASCGTPEETFSASSAEEPSSAPVPEDENAKAVRAYLDLLLAEENALAWQGDGAVEWIASDMADEVRESVKRLNAPILTGEDVALLAERAAAFYLAAWEKEQVIVLPVCGVLESMRYETGMLTLYVEHARAYNALMAYTFYLFTPPDYLFRGSEIWVEGYPAYWLSSFLEISYAHELCLPLAGDYTTRRGALNALREQGDCIRLYPSLFWEGEHPLDFAYCDASADWMRGEERVTLELDTAAGEASLLHLLHAQESVNMRLNHFLDTGDVSMVWMYDSATGEGSLCIPFSPDEAQSVREMADLLSVPLLTEESVQGLIRVFRESVFADGFVSDVPLRLPGVNGAEDVLLSPEDTRIVERLQRVLAYTFDLFTPTSCRFADLTAYEGTYYALSVPGWTYESPEEALQDFRIGLTRFLLITEEYELFFVDGEGGLSPLYLLGE